MPSPGTTPAVSLGRGYVTLGARLAIHTASMPTPDCRRSRKGTMPSIGPRR